jgi:acetate kinase
VSCHLGGGSSLAAVDRGRSVDTTMGLTPLDGLVMATRSGSVDPGLLLHLLRHRTSVDELDDLLERRSGISGLSGVSADLREVLAARDGGDERAGLAVDVFVHRLVTGIGAMIGALGGLDALVFTGGIGEHSVEIRARAVAPFAWLGADVDDDANAAATGDADVSAPEARVRVLVVTAREDLVIARAARALIGQK